MRRRIVGGTIRPGRAAAPAGTADGCAAAGAASDGRGVSCGSVGCRRFVAGHGGLVCAATVAAPLRQPVRLPSSRVIDGGSARRTARPRRPRSGDSRSGARPPHRLSAAGAGGLMVLTSRGRRQRGAVGFGGSAGRGGPDGRLPLSTGASLNSCAGGGKVMFRCRAWRSTNWRATTSSIVLEALLTSMP